MPLAPRFSWYQFALMAALFGVFAHGADDLPFTDEPEPIVQLTVAEELATAVADPQPTEVSEDPATELKRLRSRLDTLEKSEQKRAAAENKKADEDKKKKADEAAKAEDWLDMSTDKWTVKLGGHVQMDYINWAQADPDIVGAKDYFAFRRVRLLAEGTGYGIFDFRLQMTLEPGQPASDFPTGTGLSPDVKDAYLSVNELPVLGRFRIGNFFVPFGLEQVTNDTNNMFLERSIPAGGTFTADREVGIASYNCTDDQSLSWASGVFFDNISDTQKDRQDSNQGVRVSGRLNWVPYYDEPSGGRYAIHTGMGVMYTHDHDGLVRFRARPGINLGPRLIDTGSLKADDFTIGNLEFATVWGPVTVQSEAYLTNVQMLNGDSKWLNGAYAHLSYFLTGEHRIYERFGQHGAQFGRNAPFNNFFGTPGGWSLGAWEAKTRFSYLDMSTVNAGVYHDFTAGMNWYWSDRVRVMFDWIHPITNQDTIFGATQSNLIAMRMDFNW